MSDFAMSELGELLRMSLRKITTEEFFIVRFGFRSKLINELFEPSSLTPWPRTEILSSSEDKAKVHFDWKRFWALFSSEEQLSDIEKNEMIKLRKELREIYFELEQEEKRKAEELQRAIQTRLSRLGINDDRGVYLVRREDYKRGSEKERDYLRQHKNFLLRTYDNRCSKCGNDSNGLDIDHFFISKNEGGCFQMEHRDGFMVNNAIPLCETCNRAKSDRDYRSFFTSQDLLRVLEKNAKMNERLNQGLIVRPTRLDRFLEREG